MFPLSGMPFPLLFVCLFFRGLPPESSYPLAGQMPSGHAKQEEVCLSSQMEQKGFVEEVVTDLSSEGWGEGSDGWSLQRKGNFTELLEARALSQTFRVNTFTGVELTASF